MEKAKVLVTIKAAGEPINDGKVAEVSNKVNDTYLKVNKQEDGVKSYGRMVDLLLAQYREGRP